MQGSLAESLRLLRARKGLSLLAASEQLGVDRHTLRDLELGQGRTPRYPTLAKIAEGYGVPVEDLLEEPVPLADASATGHLQVRALQLRETPTAELREQVKALAGNQRAKTIEDLRTREGMQKAVAQSLVMHEATEIRAELLERGEEDPKAYLPDLRRYLDALDID